MIMYFVQFWYEAVVTEMVRSTPLSFISTEAMSRFDKLLSKRSAVASVKTLADAEAERAPMAKTETMRITTLQMIFVQEGKRVESQLDGRDHGKYCPETVPCK